MFRDYLDREPHPPHRPIFAGHRTLLSRGFDGALRGAFATESAAQHVGHEDHTEAQEGQGFEEPVLWWEASPSEVRVETPKGSYEAERLVVVSGAWAPRLLEDLALSLEVERQVMYWFEPSGGVGPFLPECFPIFIWEPDDGNMFYSFSAQDYDRSVRAASFWAATPASRRR